MALFRSLESWLAEHPKVRVARCLPADAAPSPAALLGRWRCFLVSSTDSHSPEQVNLILVDSLAAHLRPTLDSATRTLIADTVRSALSAVCSSGRVSVGPTFVMSSASSVAYPQSTDFARQVIVTTHLSLKLFGPDHQPSKWSRDAEALLVPQIAERWIPQEVNSWRLLLYYDERGERCALASPSRARLVSTRALTSLETGSLARFRHPRRQRRLMPPLPWTCVLRPPELTLARALTIALAATVPRPLRRPTAAVRGRADTDMSPLGFKTTSSLAFAGRTSGPLQLFRRRCPPAARRQDALPLATAASHRRASRLAE